MVLEINGNATILQPRPPSTNQSNVVGQKTKPGRKLKDPAAATTATKPTKMTEIVSKKILERFLHVGEAFLAFDKDRRGAIAEEDIKTGLHNWGFDLSDKALSDICQRFQHNEQGLIDYKAFCDYFADTLEGSGSLLAKRQARHYLDPRKAGQMNPRLQGLAVVDAVEVEIRKKLTEQFTSVRSAFLFFDADRSGRIHMDEFARVLERFGVVLNQQILDELQQRTEEEHAAAALNVPARKQRDAIFSSYEAQDAKAILAANMKADKMRRGIRYEDFVKHFGSVLQPSQNDHDGSDFHNQGRNQGEHKKRVGHKASHKIFGSKTTATEGKNAQKQLAKRLFSSYHELHDALVFHDRTMSGALANARFIEILERYGARKDTALKLATKYSVHEPETPKETPSVNYSGFFSVLCGEAGSAFRSYFSEENIVLQIGVSKRKDPLAKSIEHQVALQFAAKEGIPRVLSTWKLFDRANSGKITVRKVFLL
jgi:Ca2+-binding EF-hand superfamily protein